jgi:autotransporter-associated beta strand protein
LYVGDGVGPVLSDVVRVNGNPQIATVSDVIIASSGLLDLNDVSDGIGTLAGVGRVDLGSSGTGALFLNGSGNTTFSGLIIGTGGDVFKNGTGTFTLNGNNTYGGQTTVANGTLIINGSQPQSPVTISASGTLGGDGTVGNVSNTSGGVVAPGSSPAILTTSNAVFAGAGSEFNVELNGTTAGAGYDQLNVRGTVSLGGATLHVTNGFGINDAPAEGTQFVIINNDGADAVSGTFNGLASGAIITSGGLKFQISYTGGTGNDVVLTVTNTALGFVSGSISSGNGDAFIQPNECNLLNVVITNLSGVLVTNISATLLSSTPGVSVVQPASLYPNLSSNGRGTNLTPFQLSIAPTFICGQNIGLQLVVQTANQGTFNIPLVLNSGAAVNPVTFSTLGIKHIPDGGSTNSSVAVSGISAPIAKVTVSLNITHALDSDLDLFLLGPDGTIVELSTDNGGSGDNYGTNCAQRTTFDDAAATNITSASPPFFGTFRPEGSLNDFRAKSGTDVNGIWTLLITDDTANLISGDLNCWTLNLFPATCVAGGGLCELCPDVKLNGALGTNSLQQTPRLNRSGTASSCGAPKACPGPLGSGNRSYDAYTFRNGPSNACITVTLTAPLADLFSAAYTNSFDPSNLCLNYLADAGNSTFNALTPFTYSFNVASNAIFVVTVNEVNPGTGGPYTLDVTGCDCRPVLNVTPIAGNKVQLDWSTASGGYGLESTNTVIGSSPWPAVTNVPSVLNGRFLVTNNIAIPNQFYRLRKVQP